MNTKVDQISTDDKWAMTAKSLTGALVAHMDAIYSILGKEKYNELVQHIWSAIGKGAAEDMKASGMDADTTELAAEAGIKACICAMGPELKVEPVETSEKKTVIKVHECPWKNRMIDLGISHDLMSACDVAFWKHFTKNLNPGITMRHGKQMHRGDDYCEWIFKLKNTPYV